MIFNYILDIWILRLGDSGSYLNFLKQESPYLDLTCRSWFTFVNYGPSHYSIVGALAVLFSSIWHLILLELPLIADNASQGQKEFPRLRYLLPLGGGRDSPNPRERDCFQGQVACGSGIPHLCCLDAWYLWMGRDSPSHGDSLCYPFTPQLSHKWPSPGGSFIPKIWDCLLHLDIPDSFEIRLLYFAANCS